MHVSVELDQNGMSSGNAFQFFAGLQISRFCNFHLRHAGGCGQAVVLEIYTPGRQDARILCVDVLRK